MMFVRWLKLFLKLLCFVIVYRLFLYLYLFLELWKLFVSGFKRTRSVKSSSSRMKKVCLLSC